MGYNLDLSREVARAVDAKPRQCFMNAALGVAHLRSRGIEASYTEGYAAPYDIALAVEHGWITLADGTVVDPTWVGKYNVDSCYVATEHFTLDRLLALTKAAPKELRFPLVIYYHDKERGERLKKHYAAFTICTRAALKRDEHDPNMPHSRRSYVK